MRGVIIEGIDRGGKTTLAKVLKSRLKDYGGYDVKELDHRAGIEQFDRYLYEYATHDHIIFDRAHVSEAVFGEVLRDITPFSARELVILNNIVNLSFVVVLSEPPYEIFRTRYEATRAYEVISLSQYDLIVSAFRRHMGNIEYILYHSTDEQELHTVTDLVVKKLLCT